MSTQSWESLSNQAIGAAGVLYFLALMAHLVEWSSALSGAKTKDLVAAGGVADADAATRGAILTAGPDAAADDDARELRIEMFSRLGFVLTCFGVAVHGLALVSRGMAAGRVPWGNMYEFTLTGVFVLVASYVALYKRLSLSWVGPFVLTIALGLLTLGVLALYEPVAPLTEALNSYWLVIHVVSAIIATGAFMLGGIVSALYLAKDRFSWGWLGRIPSLTTLDRVGYRIHAFAFPVWTFAVLITGPIWAHEAWGSYWNWDPKEVAAFVTWVIYAAYLHARATAGWKGRNAAILALVGVVSLLFNFVGVNYFSSSSEHSYASGAPVIVGQGPRG